MDGNTALREQKWKQDVEKLEEDHDAFWAYFNKHKKCKCDVGECRHFDRALSRVLGDRIDKIAEEGLNISIERYQGVLY